MNFWRLFVRKLISFPKTLSLEMDGVVPFPTAGVCAEGRHLARRHVPTTSTTSGVLGAQPGGHLQQWRGVCDGGHTLLEQRGNHTVHRQVHTSSFYWFYCSFFVLSMTCLLPQLSNIYIELYIIKRN